MSNRNKGASIGGLIIFLIACIAFFALRNSGNKAAEKNETLQANLQITHTVRASYTATPTWEAIQITFADVEQYVDKRIEVEGFIREGGVIEGDNVGWYLTLYEFNEAIGKPDAKKIHVKVKESLFNGVRMVMAEDDPNKLVEVMLYDSAGKISPILSTNTHVRLTGIVFLDEVNGHSAYRETGKPVIRVDMITILP